MDEKSTTHIVGSRRFLEITGCVFLCLVVAMFSSVKAAPPPSIRANGKSQSLQVIDPSVPAVFPVQDWSVVAPNPFGPTLAIWSIEPFHNVNDPSNQVDAQINLQVSGHGHQEGWRVLIPQARTCFRQGANVAHVVAGSQGGNGNAGITVIFHCEEQPFVADGVFETTVVGTITEAF